MPTRVKSSYQLDSLENRVLLSQGFKSVGNVIYGQAPHGLETTPAILVNDGVTGAERSRQSAAMANDTGESVSRPGLLGGGEGVPWATYLGGSGGDTGAAIATDTEGNVWIVGGTSSIDLPGGGSDPNPNDAFIAKVNADRTLAWTRYFGGSGQDFGESIAIDGSGNAWIGGFTTSTNFPGGGFDSTYNGGVDAFIAKVNADGTLAWGSYLGGSGADRGYGINVDGEGNVWLCGSTNSMNFPAGGFDSSFNGEQSDGFVAKVNADGSLAWGSYLGGSGYDSAYSVKVDAQGNGWLSGDTFSPNFPAGGFDPTYNGGGDVFVAKVSTDGELAWGSYLGGGSRESMSAGDVLAIDADGNVWLTGTTESGLFFDTPLSTTWMGGYDCFVVKLTAIGSFSWGIYVGGNGNEFSPSIAVDRAGNAWITGATFSTDFPGGGFDSTLQGTEDAFVARIKSTGQVAWGSYLGGTNTNLYEFGMGIVADRIGNVWVVGYTNAPDFPATSGFDPIYNGGGSDAFLAVVNDPLASDMPDLLAANDSGVSSTDNVTNTLSLSFPVAVPNSQALVELLRDGVVVDSRTGTGILTDAAAPEGTHAFTIRQTFNSIQGDPSTQLRVKIDRTPPAMPPAPDLRAAFDSGVSNADNVTNNASPTFDHSAGPYFRVNLDGTRIGEDFASGQTFTSPILSDGTHAFTLLAVDEAGNVSSVSPATVVTIDTVAPSNPPVLDLQPNSDLGISQTDNITSDNTPTLDVPATAPYHRLLRSGAQISDDYSTSATFTNPALADGGYDFVVLSVDEAGNTSAAGPSLSVIIDTVAPETPGAPDLQSSSDSGLSQTDNITRDNTPTLNISSSNAYYRLSRGAIQVSGNYATSAFTDDPLADGLYSYAAQAADTAGNISAIGQALNIRIDTVGPLVPVRQFNFEVGHSLQIGFDEDVATTLINGDLRLQSLSLGTIVPTSMSYATPTATFTFPSYAAGILRNGNYRASIAAPNVTDIAGNGLAADLLFDFFVFAGDANRDGNVNLDDFTTLAAGFGTSGTFSQGDFNYSGGVNLDDFSILASQFGKTLPPNSPLLRTHTQAVAESSMSLFDPSVVRTLQAKNSLAPSHRSLFGEVAVAVGPDEVNQVFDSRPVVAPGDAPRAAAPLATAVAGPATQLFGGSLFHDLDDDTDNDTGDKLVTI